MARPITFHGTFQSAVESLRMVNSITSPGRSRQLSISVQ
jgi:hypothetical protein